MGIGACQVEGAEAAQTHAEGIDAVGVDGVVGYGPVHQTHHLVGVPAATRVLGSQHHGRDLHAHLEGVEGAVAAHTVHIVATEEKWYFSIVDVCGVLTESKDPLTARKYWNKLKQRLKEEGNETVTNCHQLKLQAADGKMRKTDVADTEQLFRLIQSIPSPKAEPFKQWMAQVAAQRLDQMQDPELGIQQALADYKRLGYSDNWMNQRLKSIEIRKDLTDEWKRRGLEEGVQFATLTDIIYHTWAGMTAREYKKFKGLKKENLRDNMTNRELVMNMLAELSTKEISESQNPETFGDHIDVARQGGEIARNARMELEAKTGKPVVSPLNAKEGLLLNKKEERNKEKGEQ